MQTSRYLFAVVLASLALFLSPTLKISKPAGSSAAASFPEQLPQTVNRAVKSDRSPLIRSGERVHEKRGTPIKSEAVSELPDGCEAMVSRIGSPPLSRVAGRCLS